MVLIVTPIFSYTNNPSARTAPFVKCCTYRIVLRWRNGLHEHLSTSQTAKKRNVKGADNIVWEEIFVLRTYHVVQTNNSLHCITFISLHLHPFIHPFIDQTKP